MTFISYSQNQEDVILWRALKHITKGFYIDVGANDPVEDSVTMAFYERKWNGINIEPLKDSYERLCAERLRDVNLQLALSDRVGEQLIYDAKVRGWATCNESVAANYEREGRQIAVETVQTDTLLNVCQNHVVGDIHFLKIDVEGAEGAVLRGMDFSVYRPWIVLVEALDPVSNALTHNEWEPLLLNATYEFVYFDGLNRFYIAQEHIELANALKIPPNVLDLFQTAGVNSAMNRANLAEAELASVQVELARTETELSYNQAELAQAKNELAQAKNELAQAKNELARVQIELSHTRTNILSIMEHAEKLQAQLTATLESFSWKITAPLRALKKYLSRF
jgi:FkbM family methyltransferase